MRLKTVLNRVHKVKGFVYEKVRWQGHEIEVTVRPHRRSRPICTCCGRRGPDYDTLPAHRFAFVPLWALSVFLVYARRRVDCPRCGVSAELLPWADGKSRLTQAYSEPPGYRQARARPKRKLEPLLPIIHEILKQDQHARRKQRHTAKRIYDRLRAEHGYDGGYTIVKDAVRVWRNQHAEVYMPLTPFPVTIPDKRSALPDSPGARGTVLSPP